MKKGEVDFTPALIDPKGHDQVLICINSSREETILMYWYFQVIKHVLCKLKSICNQFIVCKMNITNLHHLF